MRRIPQPVMAAAVGVAILVLVGVILLTRNHPLVGLPVTHATPTPSVSSSTDSPSPDTSSTPVPSASGGNTPGGGFTPSGATNTPAAFTGPQCTASMATVTVGVDQSGLNGQEVVTITGTITNHSAVTCAVTQDSGGLSCNPIADAVNDKNTAHWYSRDPHLGVACRQPAQVVLAPGKSASQQFPPWNAGRDNYPQGPYTARVTWSGIVGTSRFSLGTA